MAPGRIPRVSARTLSRLEGFEKGDLGLKPVRTGEWLGIVFVNIDGRAEPLEHHTGPLQRRYSGFDFSCLRHGATTERVFEANWKLAIEGGIEDYHLPWVHPQAVTGEGVTWTPRTVWDERHYVGVSGKIEKAGEGPAVEDIRRKGVLPRIHRSRS